MGGWIKMLIAAGIATGGCSLVPAAAAPMIERYKADPVFHDLIEQIRHTR